MRKPLPRLSLVSSDTTYGHVMVVLGHSLAFVLQVLKHKQPDRRGQIALFARGVDPGNQFRQCQPPGISDLFEVSPESVFEADARFVSINHDGTFNNR